MAGGKGKTRAIKNAVEGAYPYLSCGSDAVRSVVMCRRACVYVCTHLSRPAGQPVPRLGRPVARARLRHDRHRRQR